MKITSLIIKNIKAIESLTLAKAEKIEVFLAPNGTGKTSLQEALYFLFTGTTPCNSNHFIHNGKNYATVEAVIEMPSATGTPRQVHIKRELRAQKPSKIYIDGKTSTQKAFSKMVEDAIGITTDAAKKYISSKAAGELFNDQKSFSAWLMSMLPVSKDKTELVSYAGLTRHSEEEKLANLFPKDTGNDFTDLKNAYDSVVVDRKALKKIIASKQATVEQINSELTAGGKSPSTRLLKEIERDLLSLKNKTAQLSIYKHDIEIYNEAVKKRKIAEENIKILQKNLASMGEMPTVNESQIQRASELIRKKEAEIRNAEFVKKTAENSISKSEDFIKRLAEPICPFSTEKVQLTCSTDKTPLEKEVKENINENRKVVDIQKEIIAKGTSLIKEAEEFIKKANADKAVIEKFKKLNDELNFAKKHLPTIPKKPTPPSESKEDADKIAKLEAEKLEVAQVEKKKQLENEISNDSKELAVLENFVDILSPKGRMYSSLFNAVSAPLTDHINKILTNIYANKTVELTFDEGVSIVVKDNNGHKVSFANLSTSEKAIVMYGVQTFANAISPFNILFVDNVDKFDVNVLHNYVELVKQSDYDHIFFTGVNHNDTEEYFNKNKNNIHIINYPY